MKTKTRIALLAASAMAFSTAQVTFAIGNDNEGIPLVGATGESTYGDSRVVQGEIARFVTEIIGRIKQNTRPRFQAHWAELQPKLELALREGQTNIAQVMSAFAPVQYTDESVKDFDKRNREFVADVYKVSAELTGTATGISAWMPGKPSMPGMPTMPEMPGMPGMPDFTDWTVPGKARIQGMTYKQLVVYGAVTVATGGVVALIAYRYGAETAVKSRALIGRMAVGRNVREYDREQWLDLVFTPAQIVAHPRMFSTIAKEKGVATFLSTLGLGAVGGVVVAKTAGPAYGGTKKAAVWAKDTAESGYSYFRGYRPAKNRGKK